MQDRSMAIIVLIFLAAVQQSGHGIARSPRLMVHLFSSKSTGVKNYRDSQSNGTSEDGQRVPTAISCDHCSNAEHFSLLDSFVEAYLGTRRNLSRANGHNVPGR